MRRLSFRATRRIVIGLLCSLAAQSLGCTVSSEAVAPDLEPRPRYTSYEALARVLPTNPAGNIDWDAGVAEALLEPQPGINPDTPDAPLLTLDVLLDVGIPGMEVLFRHDSHTYWLGCHNCHPSIFQMRAGTNPVTMERIYQGESCGRCHGKVAFASETNCVLCHVRMGAR